MALQCAFVRLYVATNERIKFAQQFHPIASRRACLGSIHDFFDHTVNDVNGIALKQKARVLSQQKDI